MMDEPTARDRGLALFTEIYGEDVAQGTLGLIGRDDLFGSEQSRWTLEFTFGEVWTRPGLERRMRSATVLGMLIAQRAYDEIRYHTRMALKNGVTRQEIEEIFYTALPYCGFPAAQHAKKAMLDGLADATAADAA
jgi:4-carboxymuconolactone decarboxylase